MAWRDRLQPASFRGAPFFVEPSADTSGGRRLAIHEYPGRDRPYAEDLGRSAREYSLECIVLGADYMAARDRMVEALEREGPGTLVHPYLGTVQVLVRRFRVRETTREGGAARLSITLVEAGAERQPAAAADTAAGVVTGADAVLLTARAAFAGGFSTAAIPEFVRTAAADVIGGALDQVETLVDALPSPTAGKTGFASTLADVRGTLSSLMAAPAELAAAVTDLVGRVLDVGSDPARGQAAQEELSGWGDDLDDVPTPTATRQRQADNQAAVVALVRTGAAAEAVRASSMREWQSRTEALGARDRLGEVLDAVSEAADDETYVALADLRVAMRRNLDTRGAGLPDLAAHTPADTLPALAIAHRLYGDAAREAELVARNGEVRHPGFVPGGRALEVLAA